MGGYVVYVDVMFLAVLIALSTASCSAKVDPGRSLVYGPGLSPHLVYPVRYFYIQAIDSLSKNFTRSPGRIFDVNVDGVQEPCRTWTQVLDRRDGTFIVRYRLLQSCDGLRIEVLVGGKHVAQSPYIFKSQVYHEDCYCPVKDIYEWQDGMQCATVYQQIHEDLAPFADVDMDGVLAEAVGRFNHAGSHSLCNFVVLDNEVYRKCYGQHVGFKMFMDNILLSLARKVHLPNLDFIVNLGDWPLVRKDVADTPIPMFSWCGSESSHDIVMPTYDLTESTLETMGRVSLDMMSVQSNTGPLWDRKIEVGFWRGRDSRRERLQLVYLSKKRPDLVNASLTNFFFFQELEEEYGPKVKHISFFDFFEYKYQINIDGTVAAYRMPYLLAGDSVILKQDSEYYEHFYHDLEPMVHYVPFKEVLADLTEKLGWVKANDNEARHIAQNGQSHARENLMPKDIFCYHIALFENYAKRIRSHVRVRDGMEHVPQSSDAKSQCRCDRAQQSVKDEL